MATSSSSSTSSVGDWDKWKVGLALGGLACLGLAGIWFYNRDRSKLKTKKNKNAKNGNNADASVSDSSSGVQPESDLPLEEESRVGKAQALKNKGNKYFKGGKYDEAIRCYTQALEVCPQEESQDISTFYANRAAAYEKLKNYQKVVEDCTEALKLNPKYTKALSRRSNASEQLGDLTQSLEDVTALCILEGFQNQITLQAADRVLKELGKRKAHEAYMNRKPLLPSKTFIRSYLSSFTLDPVFSDADQEREINDSQQKISIPTSQDSAYMSAVSKLQQQEYEDIIPLCTTEINLSPSSPNLLNARLLRSTFSFLAGQLEESRKDLDLLLEKEDLDKKMRVNVLIKRGSLLIQQEKQTEGLADFAQAVRIDPDNSDVYHHRGHQNIQLERLDDAIKDFENSILKNDKFPISYVQKAYAEHKKAALEQNTGKLQAALQSYELTLKKFPKCPDAHALYAQVLCDLGRFDEADAEFEKAIELEPDNGTVLVHRGLLKLQWQSRVEEALSMINKAIEIDPKCEYAYEVLGTLEVQKGDMIHAVSLFNTAIGLCKTESEMAHLYSLLNAAQAQMKVAKNLGIPMPAGFSM